MPDRGLRSTPPDALALARIFHEECERLAPELGYRTHEESSVPWDRVPATNKNLMVATARAVLERIGAGERETEYLRTRMLVAVSFLAPEQYDTFREHVADLDKRYQEATTCER